MNWPVRRPAIAYSGNGASATHAAPSSAPYFPEVEADVLEAVRPVLRGKVLIVRRRRFGDRMPRIAISVNLSGIYLLSSTQKLNGRPPCFDHAGAGAGRQARATSKAAMVRASRLNSTPSRWIGSPRARYFSA